MQCQFTSFFVSRAKAENFAGMVDGDVEPVPEGTAPWGRGARWQVPYFQEVVDAEIEKIVVPCRSGRERHLFTPR